MGSWGKAFLISSWSWFTSITMAAVRGLTHRTLWVHPPGYPPCYPPFTLRVLYYISLSFYYHFMFISSFILRVHPPCHPPVLTLRTDLHLRLPSGLYSIIVRYLFILFPEPSTACPRVVTVYIQLLNSCYGFPQIISLWIPLTGQSPFL